MTIVSLHIKIFLPALCRYFLIFSGMICDYGKHMPSPYGHSLNVLDSAQDEIQIGYYWVHNLPCSYFAFSVLPDICWIPWYASSLGWKLSFFCGFCNEIRVVFLMIFGNKSRPTKVIFLTACLLLRWMTVSSDSQLMN